MCSCSTYFMKKIKIIYLINVNSINLLITVKADQFEIWLTGENELYTWKRTYCSCFQSSKDMNYQGNQALNIFINLAHSPRAICQKEPTIEQSRPSYSVELTLHYLASLKVQYNEEYYFLDVVITTNTRHNFKNF